MNEHQRPRPAKRKPPADQDQSIRVKDFPPKLNEELTQHARRLGKGRDRLIVELLEYGLAKIKNPLSP